MLLEGSCHCGAVRFRVRSRHPYPFNLCYCSICRKTAGAGGYAINLGGDHATLEVEGGEQVRVYRARIRDADGTAPEESPTERHFCGRCAAALWVWDKRWSEWIYPFASAIDTPLPSPRERQHIFLDSKPRWVRLGAAKGDKRFRRYPKEAIIDWHRKRGLLRP